MPTAVHDIGDVHIITAAFTDSVDVATDPTAVVFEMREPDGTDTTFTFGVDSEVTNPSVGTFLLTFAITKAGRHFSRVKGTGAVAAASATEFYADRKSVV